VFDFILPYNPHCVKTPSYNFKVIALDIDILMWYNGLRSEKGAHDVCSNS